MSDYKRARVPQTRSQGGEKTGRGQHRSVRTEAEQKAHEASYGKVYKQRARDLNAAATTALREHLEDCDRLWAPTSSIGQFTPYACLVLEFVSLVDQLEYTCGCTVICMTYSVPCEKIQYF